MMKPNITWQQGTPDREGQYMVAVEMAGSGYFDVYYWDGGIWRANNPERIYAFVGMDTFVQQVGLEWPVFGSPLPSESPPDPDDLEAWEEV